MSPKIYVGNLPSSTTENDLKDLFSKHGNVSEVELIMDRASGRSRGFAFVTMENPEEANAAIQALNGYELEGRALTVNEARPKEERPRFAGGGGGGGAGGGRSRRGRREFHRR